MNFINEKDLKYINILNGMYKQLSKFERLLILRKHRFTDNMFYYLLSLIIRFIYLISFLGDYHIFFDKNNSNKSIQQYMQQLTCFKIIKELKISFLFYSYTIIIIFIISLIRSLINIYIFIRINDYKNIYIWTILNKFLIIIDHIRFALFPYLIEYLSFSYYIVFLSNKFIPNLIISNTALLIVITILNTFLMILYNFDLFWDMICINKIFTIPINELQSNKVGNILNYTRNNHFSYKCSVYFIYLLTILQNISIFLNIEYFIEHKKIFKIIITIIIFIFILMIIYKLLKQFDFPNYVLTVMNILFLYCFYSIIMDLIIAKFLNNKFKLYNNIIYIIIKLITSYLTLLLILLKANNTFKNKIIQLFFNERNDKTKNSSIESLYYMHEIMLKIYLSESIESATLIIKFINNNHIKICNKEICNCKLLKFFINEEILNKDELIKYSQKLIIFLNYLFESVFINFDYYNNFDASVLLAEHYCHNRNNPIMAFSIINTYFIKHKYNKLSKPKKILLNELSQKYISYITSTFIKNKEIKGDEEECLLHDKIIEEFNLFFFTLNIVDELKINMINFINNYINILKYKNIFDDSLSFIYDENNENIISVKNNFFKQTNKIDDDKNKDLKKYENTYNLYKVIHLLTKEKSLYHIIEKIINNLDKMNNIPIDSIFKSILFINIFGIEKINVGTKEKLFNHLSINKSKYDSYAKIDEYEILKIQYKRINNEKDSKMYSIFEFKRELITKYFSEFGALKLGFKQREIINNKIDILMPEKFANSHLNMVKYYIINKQTKLSLNTQIYLYDKTTTILYPVSVKLSFIYNINKYLNFLIECSLISENKYRFMLDSNLELMANSQNFENEYYLNQKIFHIYNIRLVDILNIHPNKLKNVFSNEIKNIQHQKLIRQFRTEEYFLPQLYVPLGEKPINIMNNNHLKKSKNKIISKIIKKDNESEEYEFVKNNKSNNLFCEIFTNSQIIAFHKTFNKKLNKKKFIEKLEKELLKIQENDLILEKDKKSHNLINHSKKLVNYMLSKKELSNQIIEITTEFKYFYDKVFYFIIIKDENNSFFNLNKKIPLETGKREKDKFISSTSFRKEILGKLETNKVNEDSSELKTNEKDENQVFNKLNDMREKINKNKSIFIIKVIISIILLSIIIIDIIIIYIQKHIDSIVDLTVCSFFYDIHAKNLALFIYSLLLQVFYDYSNYTDNNINKEDELQNTLTIITSGLQENFHNFTTFYILENILLGTDVKLIYQKETFYKIRRFWEESKYISDYTNEGDFLNYYLYVINITNVKGKEPEFIQDLKNFLFYKEKSDTKEKINTIYIRLLYYICNNYQFEYRRLYQIFQDDVYNDYESYAEKEMMIYLVLDILGLIFYFICFILVICFLFVSNQIIIKNLIFLFIDFNKEGYKNKNKDVSSNLKLNEIKKLIEDFNLFRFETFLDNLNRININKALNNNDNIIINDQKESEKNSIDKMIKSPKGRNKFLDRKKRGTNNSSYNYLSASNSQLFKDNLNASVKINKNLSFNTKQNNKKKDEENDQIIQDIILNKSNTIFLPFIIVYSAILAVLLIALIIFTYYKITFNIKLNEGTKEIYIDSAGITDRYSILFYAFNIFRTLLIFPEGEKKRKFEEIMQNIQNYYEEENNKFVNIRASEGMIKNFIRTTNLMNHLMEGKNNSTETLKNLICELNISCQKYLDSKNNIFDSGLDFGFVSSLTYISNMYLDYKNLENKYDMDLINKTIINNKNSHFKDIGLGLINFLLIAIEKLFLTFKDDINGFLVYKINITSLFNIISFILAIGTFLFIIGFVFISIKFFTEPIKESAYRISFSLYYIKQNN